VSATTSNTLIVAEAMHESAAVDIEALIATIAAELTSVWPGPVQTQILRPEQPLFRPLDTGGDAGVA
jgi:DNA/RNA-binding domain of Phe-tRNA-synthetase-like protein